MDTNYFRNRNKLLRYWFNITWGHCFFCGGETIRRAIMDDTTVCCVQCDRTRVGAKITMSEAQTKYSLRKSELFGGKIPEYLGGPPNPIVDGIIPQRRGLRFGRDTSTTMFLEEDVKRLAFKKHKVDNIDDLLLQKQEKSVLRKTKIEENKLKMLSYIRRLAMVNGLNPLVTARRIVHRSLEKRRGPVFQMVKADCILKMLGVRFRSKPSDSVLGYNTPVRNNASKLFRYMDTLLPKNRFTKVDNNDKVISGIDRYVFNWAAETRYARAHKVMKPVSNGKGKGKHEPFIYQDDAMDADQATNDESTERQEAGSENEDESESYTSLIPREHSEIDEMPTKNYVAEYADEELHRLIYLRQHDNLLKNRKDSPWETVEIEEWADPVDYCLFESYIREFGAPEIPPPTRSYTELRDIYSVKESGGTIAETAIFGAPWSWGNYPLLVREVTWEDHAPTPMPAPMPAPTSNMHHSSGNSGFLSAAEKDARDRDEAERLAVLGEQIEKVRVRNEKHEAEYEKMKLRIKRVVREHGWGLLGQDGGAKWKKIMLDEEMAGR